MDGLVCYVPVWLTCPVCLGAGQISDSVPVSDCLADAATLHMEWEQRSLSIAIWTDARPGYTVRPASIGEPPVWTMDDYVAGAKMAARAAFRAVPELRGE